MRFLIKAGSIWTTVSQTLKPRRREIVARGCPNRTRKRPPAIRCPRSANPPPVKFAYGQLYDYDRLFQAVGIELPRGGTMPQPH